MERRAQACVSLDISNRFWQPQRRLWSLQIARSRDVFCPPFAEPAPIGKAKQDACQELLVEALKPLEGRCSQRPDARQKIILVGISETAGDASNFICLAYVYVTGALPILCRSFRAGRILIFETQGSASLRPGLRSIRPSACSLGVTS